MLTDHFKKTTNNIDFNKKIDYDWIRMHIPPVVFKPPFNITRASHVTLTSRDLERSVHFYTSAIGLVVTSHEGDRVYLRGLEEAAHHSLVLELSSDSAPSARRIGFRVQLEEDLDMAEQWLRAEGIDFEYVDRPHQGRTLQFSDPTGIPVELCATMETRPRQFASIDVRGAAARRLDHFQAYVPDVSDSLEFWARLGFRTSEYIQAGDTLNAAFLYRKGNTHDFVLFRGAGPQLHHFAYVIDDRSALFRACDAAGVAGFGDHIDRGPGRHGYEGALFVYFLDPDGHRVEVFDGTYQTIDSEVEPRAWDVSEGRQPWGLPAKRSWFFDCSPFEGVAPTEPSTPSNPATLEQYLEAANSSTGAIS